MFDPKVPLMSRSRQVPSSLLTEQGDVLSGEALISEAAVASAKAGGNWRRTIINLEKVLLTSAHMLLYAYSVDSFLMRHQLAPRWLRVVAMSFFAVLTASSQVFSKLPLLDKPFDALGLDAKEQRFAQAIERGFQQVSSLPVNCVTIYAQDSELKSLTNTIDKKRLQLLLHYLLAKYSLPYVTVFKASSLSEAIAAYGSRPSGRVVCAVLTIDTQPQGLSDYIVRESALPGTVYAIKHPLLAVYYSVKWLALKAMFALSYLLMINHAAHNLQKHWLGLGVHTSALWLGVAIVANTTIGGVCAKAEDAIVMPKTYAELARWGSKLKHLACALPKKQQVMAFALAVVVAIPVLLFHASLALYFGHDGVTSLLEQWSWLLGRETVPEAPKFLLLLSVGLMLLSRTLTALSTMIIETYRALEQRFMRPGLAVAERSHPTQRYQCYWLLVLAVVTVESVALALVAANSAEQVAMPVLHDAQNSMAMAVGIGVSSAVTWQVWSVASARWLFSGVLRNLFGIEQAKPSYRPLVACGSDASGQSRSGSFGVEGEYKTEGAGLGPDDFDLEACLDLLENDDGQSVDMSKLKKPFKPLKPQRQTRRAYPPVNFMNHPMPENRSPRADPKRVRFCLSDRNGGNVVITPGQGGL